MSNSELPRLSVDLIRELDGEIPAVDPKVNHLSSEEARLRLAREIGRREVVQSLLERVDAGVVDATADPDTPETVADRIARHRR